MYKMLTGKGFITGNADYYNTILIKPKKYYQGLFFLEMFKISYFCNIVAKIELLKEISPL
jgi:hypothetical protein